ncbi:MAG: CpsD/CapB family tyrosine-protein kinase [Clostridia bacterium]
MRKDIIVHEFPKNPVSEAIRLLRTNLTYMTQGKNSNVFLVVSTMPGEGKSWISANLGIAYAQANKKVLIIDADLRKGRQHKIFGRYNTVGFSDYLQSCSSLSDDIELHDEILMKSITTTEVSNLFLMPSGPTPYNPSELLGISNMKILLETLKANFDIILFDAPPISIVADGLILSKFVDSTIIVASVGETKKDMLANTKKSLENVGAKIAGVVLNKMPNDKRKEYTKYYAHYSDEGIVESDRSKRQRKNV